MKNKIIILSGDPNSINSELIFKCWKKINIKIKNKIFLISNYDLIKQQLKKLNYSIDLVKVNNINEKVEGDKLKLIHIDLNFKNPFNVPLEPASKFITKSLNLAHILGVNKEVKGILNCPINKKLLKKNNIGVTEFFASKCNIKNDSEVMLIRNNKLSVSPLTTHLDIKDVSKRINKKMIIKKIETINMWFTKIFKKKPKIAVLGLNPHNAELRSNSEEVKIIIPAIKHLKKVGMKIYGPIVSDTFFINEFKNFDVVLGMYHDQVLSPFKSLFKFDAINITLGLKYLRVSPDHGTAADIIGKNKANYTSLLKCINFIDKFGK